MAFAAGGAPLLEDFFRRVGFYGPPAIEIAEVVRPRTPKRWADVTVATTSFGHGIAVTPLQFVDAVGGLVRDGTRVPPTLLKRDPAATCRRAPATSPSTTAELLRWLMWLVVEHGTGTQAKLDSYEIGGKTGTAEKPERRALQPGQRAGLVRRRVPDRRSALRGVRVAGRAEGRRRHLRPALRRLDRGTRWWPRSSTGSGRCWAYRPAARGGGGLSRPAGDAAPEKRRSSRGRRRALRLAALCDDRLAPARQRRGRDRRPRPRLARGPRRRPVRGDAGHAHRRRPLPRRRAGRRRSGRAGRRAAPLRRPTCRPWSPRSRAPPWPGSRRASSAASRGPSWPSPAPAARARSRCSPASSGPASASKAASLGTLGCRPRTRPATAA